MIETLITLLIVAVVIYVIVLIIGMIPLPPTVKTIAYLIVGLVVLFWLLNYFGIYSSNIGSIRINK